MEQRKPSLNPNAAPFMPFHKREANGKNGISELTEGSSKSSNETARPLSLTQGHYRTEKYFQPAVSDSDIHGMGWHLNDSDVMRTDHENLCYQMGEQYVDEDTQMDIAYLAHMFPDIAEHFLVDVYSANGGDMEDTVDMLRQLSCFPSALPKLPRDCLDTNGDLKCKVKAEGSSVKPQNSDSGEGGASFQ